MGRAQHHAGTIRAWKWDGGEFTTIYPPGALHSEASEITSGGAE